MTWEKIRLSQASKSMSSKFCGGGDLFEQTIFTMEAMADINEMYGKPLDLLRNSWKFLQLNCFFGNEDKKVLKEITKICHGNYICRSFMRNFMPWSMDLKSYLISGMPEGFLSLM